MSTTLDETDENEEVDPQEIEAAADETFDSGMRDPEVDEQTEDLTVWDEPAASSGVAVPRVGMEDEFPPVEQLIEEGLEQADRDQRMAAVDPDFEP